MQTGTPGEKGSTAVGDRRRGTRPDDGTAGWREDFLGPDFQQLRLELGTDEEGPVIATLIRHLSHSVRLEPSLRPADPPQAVLYVHGWADYFFQTEMAEFFSTRGPAFYAVDLRKYGRSLMPGQSEGFTTALRIYDQDLDAALAAIGTDVAHRTGRAEPPRIHLVGHSLGGLK